MNQAVPTDERPLFPRALRGTSEAVLLALIVLSPWAFGAVHPLAVLGLFAGLALCLLLWAAALLAEGRPPLTVCPVALCLALMVLLGVCQVVPLADSALSAVAPSNAAWWTALLPAAP